MHDKCLKSGNYRANVISARQIKISPQVYQPADPSNKQSHTTHPARHSVLPVPVVGSSNEEEETKREGTFKRAIELLESGCSTRAAMRQLRSEGYGADNNMIMAAYELADIPDCKCGRPNGHKGWSSEKMKNSPKRQAYLNRVRKNAQQSQL